jgi:hypothetical protein
MLMRRGRVEARNPATAPNVSPVAAATWLGMITPPSALNRLKFPAPKSKAVIVFMVLLSESICVNGCF